MLRWTRCCTGWLRTWFFVLRVLKWRTRKCTQGEFWEIKHTHKRKNLKKNFWVLCRKIRAKHKKKQKKNTTRTRQKKGGERAHFPLSITRKHKGRGTFITLLLFRERERLIKRDLPFLSSLFSFVRAWRGVWREQCPSEKLWYIISSILALNNFICRVLLLLLQTTAATKTRYSSASPV